MWQDDMQHIARWCYDMCENYNNCARIMWWGWQCYEGHIKNDDSVNHARVRNDENVSVLRVLHVQWIIWTNGYASLCALLLTMCSYTACAPMVCLRIDCRLLCSDWQQYYDHSSWQGLARFSSTDPLLSFLTISVTMYLLATTLLNAMVQRS